MNADRTGAQDTTAIDVLAETQEQSMTPDEVAGALALCGYAILPVGAVWQVTESPVARGQWIITLDGLRPAQAQEAIATLGRVMGRRARGAEA